MKSTMLKKMSKVALLLGLLVGGKQLSVQAVCSKPLAQNQSCVNPQTVATMIEVTNNATSNNADAANCNCSSGCNTGCECSTNGTSCECTNCSGCQSSKPQDETNSYGDGICDADAGETAQTCPIDCEVNNGGCNPTGLMVKNGNAQSNHLHANLLQSQINQHIQLNL